MSTNFFILYSLLGRNQVKKYGNQNFFSSANVTYFGDFGTKMAPRNVGSVQKTISFEYFSFFVYFATNSTNFIATV